MHLNFKRNHTANALKINERNATNAYETNACICQLHLFHHFTFARTHCLNYEACQQFMTKKVIDFKFKFRNCSNKNTLDNDEDDDDDNNTSHNIA